MKIEERERTIVETKPLLRGWIHTVMAPLALIGGIIIVIAAPTAADKISCAIFTVAGVLLFGNSGIYHRGEWSPTTNAVLRRLDHANIFLVIAGTYTPLAVMLLPTSQATVLLWIVWIGAAVGLLARMFWLNAPRWVYVPIYLGLGWVAVGYLGSFYDSAGWAGVLLIILGGVAYSVGAVCYALKRPNPSPKWFGFHEIFHVCTVLGWGAHFAAVCVAISLS